MNSTYAIINPSKVYSPALLFYVDLIRRNIARAIEIAGGPTRLRPHVKTHKTREIVRLAIAAGITKHKCATIAEAELLADSGAADVLVAYSLVGPNCARLANLVKAYPACRFSVLVDHPSSARVLSEAMCDAQQTVDVWLDVNSGQNRTGIAPGPHAVALYELIDQLPNLRPVGLHFYDGHQRQETRAERQAAVETQIEPFLELRDELRKKGLPAERVIVGGTPTFPVYSSLGLSDAEYGPGTCILYDHGYATRFADLTGFSTAAFVLTRVVSRPTVDRVTLDLGTKAVASDMPFGERVALLDVPAYEPVSHNEEHLVITTAAAERYSPGDEVYAIPAHVCPTCALYRFAHVVQDGQIVDQWEIAARDRVLRY